MSDEPVITILCLSDPHGDFDRFPAASLPAADFAVIAGDFTNNGRKYGPGELAAARAWMDDVSRRYPRVFFVCGNHDWGMDNDSLRTAAAADAAQGIEDRTAVWRGLKMLGASLSPCFDAPALAAAFCRMTADRSRDAAEWEDAPAADVVVSHCPPFGILDSAGKLYDPKGGRFGDLHLGSPGLRRYVRIRRPRLVVCGHIHEAAGAQLVHAVGTQEEPTELVPDAELGAYDTQGPDAAYKWYGSTLVVNCARRPALVTLTPDTAAAVFCAENVRK